MSRTPNTATRRAEIVAALLPVLARTGYEKATIVAIAKEAGLAPGLIHYHFKTKQEILISLVESIAGFARARFAQEAERATTPDERLDAYIAARLGLGTGAAADMVAAWVMIGAEAVRQEEVRSVYQRAIGDELAGLTQLLRDCLAERGRAIAPAPQLAAGLLAMIEGAFQLSCAAGTVMPQGYAAQCARDFVRQGIESAPAA